jgi:hypothetical protein
MKLSPVRRPIVRVDYRSAHEGGNRDTVFAYLQTGQEPVNFKAVSLQTQEREAVVISLPISMHAGQIFLLTKVLTATNLRFYEFDAGTPVHRWHPDSSGS